MTDDYPLARPQDDETLTPLPGRVRLMTFVLLRWLAVAGQFIAVFTIHFGLGYHLPLMACLAVMIASAALNVVVSLRYPSTRRLTRRETAAYIVFDIIQLSTLLALTGGLANPFAVLIIAPVVIASTTLTPKTTISIVLLAFAAISLIGIYHYDLPWGEEQPPFLPALYIWGIWAGLVLGIGFTTAYVWRVATEAKRMSDALAATQTILTREHRLAALGGLAAAAAHELGTPLATIALVTKELRRDMPEDGPYSEDMSLLESQVDRCREILRRLSVRPEEGDARAAQMPLGALLADIAEPHADFGIKIVIHLHLPDGRVVGPDWDPGAQPQVLRRAEIQHGLGNFFENAVDFARSTVTIDARWNDTDIMLTIIDDGPGFSEAVIDRLGEPYVTTRATATNLRPMTDDDAPQGMGLGFFIAKTMIERIGGTVQFANRGGAGGAQIDVRWPRAKIDTNA